MTAKAYRVAGPHRVFGHEPGSTFTADLPAVQEQRLVDSGALELAPKPVNLKKPDPKE